MSLFRVTFLSAAAFLTPILVSLYITAYLWDEGQLLSGFRLSSAGPSEPASKKLEQAQPKVIQVGKGASFVTVPNDQGLDPITEKKFVLSLLVRLERLPEVGTRHNIITKYASDAKPYPGWALSIKRFSTSVRPEVYLKNASGNGGWFAFDDFDFKLRRWYALTVLLKPGEFVSLFAQDLGFQMGPELPAGEDWADSRVPLETSSAPVFLGGYDVHDIDLLGTNADVYLGARRSGENRFRGEVAMVLIAQTTELDSRISSATEYLDGGSAYLIKHFDVRDVSLWLASSGKDESPHSRQIEFTGRATWQSPL